MTSRVPDDLCRSGLKSKSAVEENVRFQVLELQVAASTPKPVFPRELGCFPFWIQDIHGLGIRRVNPSKPTRPLLIAWRGGEGHQQSLLRRLFQASRDH